MEIKAKRDAIPHSIREEQSIRLCKALFQWPLIKQSKTIAIYKSFRSEVNLDYFFFHAPHTIYYFPKILESSILCFLPANHDTPFKPGPYGILEPDVDIQCAILLNDLDILMLPLIAFDTQGHRLGAGGGFYDRTLTKQRPKHLIGVAYDEQIVAQLPHDPWDILLDWIITPTQIYQARPPCAIG